MARDRRTRKEKRVKSYLHDCSSKQEDLRFTQLYEDVQGALRYYDMDSPSSMTIVSMKIEAILNKQKPEIANFLLAAGAKSSGDICGQLVKLGVNGAILSIGTTRAIEGNKGCMTGPINVLEQQFKKFAKHTAAEDITHDEAILKYYEYNAIVEQMMVKAADKSEMLLEHVVKLEDILRSDDSPLLVVPQLVAPGPAILAPVLAPQQVAAAPGPAILAPVPAPQQVAAAPGPAILAPVLPPQQVAAAPGPAILAPVLAPQQVAAAPGPAILAPVPSALKLAAAPASAPVQLPTVQARGALPIPMAPQVLHKVAPPQTTVAVAGAAVMQLPKDRAPPSAPTAPRVGRARGLPMNLPMNASIDTAQVDIPMVQSAPSPGPAPRPVPDARMDSSDGENMMLDGPDTFQNPDRESGSGSDMDMELEEARGLGKMFGRFWGKKKADAKHAPVYTMLQSQEVMADLEKNPDTVPAPGSTRFLELRQRTGLRGDALVELINTVHRSMTGVAVHPATPTRPVPTVQLANTQMTRVAHPPKITVTGPPMNPEEHKKSPARTAADRCRDALEKTKAVRALFLSLFSKTDKADVPKITLMQSQYIMFDFENNKGVPEAGSNRMKALRDSTGLPEEVIAKCSKGMMDKYEARVAHPAPMPAPLPAPLPVPMPVQNPALKRAAHALKRSIEGITGNPVDVKKQKMDGRPVVSRKRTRSDSVGIDGSKKRKVAAQQGADHDDME